MVTKLIAPLPYVLTPFLGFPLYPILFSNSGSPVIFVVKVEMSDTMTRYEIQYATDIVNQVSEVIFAGIDSEGAGPLPLLDGKFWSMSECETNCDVISNYSGINVGANNEVISKLVSITPFVEVQEQLTLNSFLTGIADAIRSKKGTNDKINASNFASEIESIESGDNTLKKLLDAKKSASSLFYGFETDNISEIIQYNDTENVTKFTSMFQTSAITTIPLLNTSNGTIFYSMFQDCSKLRKIPLIDTSNGTNFSYMFYQCVKLTELPLIDTSNGTNFSYMFHRTDSLRTLPQIDTSKGTNFEKMFNQSGLTEIPPLNTSNATNFNCMFGNGKIEKIDISHYNINVSSNTKDLIINAFKLKQ